MDTVREIGMIFVAICRFAILFVLMCAGFAIWAWRRKSVYGDRSIARTAAQVAGELSVPDFEFPDLWD